MTLDICYGGCGGIWFDAHELERVTARAAATLHTIWQVPVDEKRAGETPALPGATAKKPAEPRVCPRCDGQVLDRKWFSDLKRVEIDQCPICGGVWLDAGEFSPVYEEIHNSKVAPPGWACAMAEAAQVVRQNSTGRKRDMP